MNYEKINKEKIDYFIGNLSFIYSQYYIWQELKKYKKYLPQRLKKVLLTSLVRGFLLGLSALLEPAIDKKGNKNFSINIIDNVNFNKKHKNTKKAIINIRRKILAHNDLEAFQNIDKFLKNSSISDSKKLLDKLLDLVKQVANELFPNNKIDLVFNNIEQECINDVLKLMRSYAN